MCSSYCFIEDRPAACHMPDQSRAVLYQLSKSLSPDAGVCFIDSSHVPNNCISMLCLLVYNQRMSAYIAHCYSNAVETMGFDFWMQSREAQLILSGPCYGFSSCFTLHRDKSDGTLSMSHHLPAALAYSHNSPEN